MPLSPSFAGVVLAAGASSRMGRDKALLPWRDGTFLSTAIRALQPATELVLVVAGANAPMLEPIANAYAAFMVINPEPQALLHAWGATRRCCPGATAPFSHRPSARCSPPPNWCWWWPERMRPCWSQSQMPMLLLW